MHCNNCVDSILEYDQVVPLKAIAQVKMYNMMVLWPQKVIQKTSKHCGIGRKEDNIKSTIKCI